MRSVVLESVRNPQRQRRAGVRNLHQRQVRVHLPAELDRGRNYCLHALCLGEMLSANGVAINAWDYVRAPSRFMAHEYFPLRLGAAELLVAMCAQLSTTHVLEGAACLAAAANQTESHDIAIR